MLVEAFAKELAPYERSKGTLEFPLSEPVPFRLIERSRVPGPATHDGRRRYGPAQRRTGRTGRWDPPHLRRASQRVREDAHGTPCFFVEQGRGCFAMFSEHRRDDGRLSLSVPAADGLRR